MCGKASSSGLADTLKIPKKEEKHPVTLPEYTSPRREGTRFEAVHAAAVMNGV